MLICVEVGVAFRGGRAEFDRRVINAELPEHVVCLAIHRFCLPYRPDRGTDVCRCEGDLATDLPHMEVSYSVDSVDARECSSDLADIERRPVKEDGPAPLEEFSRALGDENGDQDRRDRIEYPKSGELNGEHRDDHGD